MSSQTIRRVVEDIGQVYSDLARQHGADPRAAGYHDRAKRDIRYAKLAEIFDLDPAPEHFTINELGCGYGAFYIYLDERMPGRITHYYGYDISDEMLKAGRDHLAAKPATLIRDSVVTAEADYTFLSGIFNVRLSAGDEEWQHHMEQTLRRCFAMSRRGLAFNCLSETKIDFRNERFYYSDPEELLAFCRRELSARVRVDEDYPLYELTVTTLRE